MSRKLVVLALACLWARGLAGQLPLPVRTGPFFQWRGEVGSLGELYRTTDSVGRRPGETGRLFLNSTATLFGTVSMGVNLLLTSEDGASAGAGFGGLPGRQSIAQFGLHPVWSWGRAHLGTFSDAYTPFTYNGVRVTGAAFDFNPGLLRVAAFGGRSRDAVPTGAATGSYQRSTAGGRLGVGRRAASGQPASYFDLTVVRVADDPTSLPSPVDTTLPINSPAQAALNPFALTPQENLVVSGAAGLALLEQRLAWRGEFAASVHTRDRRATELDEALLGDYPGLLRELITPRVGTHLDYAYSSDFQLRVPQLPGATRESPRALTANLQFRHVGPGYVALGAASLPGDQESLGLQTSLRFGLWSLRLDGMRQRDNLADQKLATTVRYRTGGTFTVQPRRGWTSTLRGHFLSMGNGLVDSLSRIDYATWSVGMSQTVALGPRRVLESATLEYSYQRAGDENPLRASSGFVSHNADVRASVRLGTAIKLTPSLGVARSYVGVADGETRAMYGVTGAWRSQGGRLRSSGTVSRSRLSQSGTVFVRFTADYRLTEQDEIAFSAQTSRFRDWETPMKGYNENIVSVRWARRF